MKDVTVLNKTNVGSDHRMIWAEVKINLGKEKQFDKKTTYKLNYSAE